MFVLGNVLIGTARVLDLLLQLYLYVLLARAPTEGLLEKTVEACDPNASSRRRKSMKISPMDIQRQTFAATWRGFDKEEVRTYLHLVAEELAALQRERDLLHQQSQNLQAVVDEAREREAILKNTLLTAQRASEEIKENARRSAESTTKEAELQADRLLELAQSRAHEVERSILDLRGHRTTLRTDIRAFITRLTHLLDLQEEAELEDNLRFLKRREEAR
jgi:cell division initiation protein